eukprot:1281343-Amphidinium_carterae.2
MIVRQDCVDCRLPRDQVDWLIAAVVVIVCGCVPPIVDVQVDAMVRCIVQPVMLVDIVSTSVLVARHLSVQHKLIVLCLCQPCKPEVIVGVVHCCCWDEAVPLDCRRVSNERHVLDVLIVAGVDLWHHLCVKQQL